MIDRGTALVLALTAAFATGCADAGVEEMVARPKLGPADGAAAAARRVVLFRAVVDVDGQILDEPWSLHYFSGLRPFTVVGPKDVRLASRRSFLPGRPDAGASDAGWAFLALPPGAYQLAFEGMAIRFAMAGAQFIDSDAIPIGRSPPAVFVVPADSNLVYAGTFNFTCHQAKGGPDALKVECTKWEVRDEARLAGRIAETSLSQYGPMQEALASAPQWTRSP
jgi:hypothetical protein